MGDTEDNLAMLEQVVENLKERMDAITDNPVKKTLHNIESTEDVNVKLDELVKSIEFLTQTVDELRTDVQVSRKEMQGMNVLQEEVNLLKYQNQKLHEKLTRQEDYSRRDNMIVTGIK